MPPCEGCARERLAAAVAAWDPRRTHGPTSRSDGRRVGRSGRRVIAVGRTPVSGRSRFRRLAGRPYTEVDGQPVVVNLERRTCIPLSPSAVALWAALDGRPLADLVVAGEPGTPDPLPACVELLRRWRALGLIEEDEVIDDESGAHPVDAPARCATVSLRARAAASGAVLVVGPDVTDVATITLDPPGVVGAGRPLVGLVGLAAPDGAGAGLAPLDVFGLLVAAGPDDVEAPVSLVDALAELAESLTGRVVASADPDSVEAIRAVVELAG